MNGEPSEQIKAIWTEAINEFPKFISELFSEHEEEDANIATYAQIAVDSDKNRKKLIRSFSGTLFSKYDSGLYSACFRKEPYFSKHTLTEKDLENPYIRSVKDEPFVKIQMEAWFK